MIAPSQVTYNVSGLPALAQAAIASIDQTLQTWEIQEEAKYWQIQWVNQGGWTLAKEKGLRQIAALYESLGWYMRIVTADQATFRVEFRIQS